MRALKRERAMAQRVSAAAARGARDGVTGIWQSTSLLSATEANAYHTAWFTARKRAVLGA